MSDRYPGGIITKTPVTPAGPYAEGSAPGVWTLEQQAYWQAQGLWPNASNPTPNDPYFQYVTSLLHGDGTNGGQNNTFLDSSSNAFTITRNGNTTQGSFSPYGSNWGNYFPRDGAGTSRQYLYTGSNVSGISGDFTIECWVNFADVTTDNVLFGLGDASSNGFFVRVEYVGSTGPNTLNFYAAGDHYVNFPSVLQNGGWNHIAVTRQSNTLKVWLNGVQQSTTHSLSTSFSSDVFYIGAGKLGATVPYNPNKGYMSNVRLVNGTAVYTSDFTPSTTPLTAITNTAVLTCQSNRFVDNSSNNYSIVSATGTSATVQVTRFSPFAPTYATQYSASTIGGSGYFDGTGDYLNGPNASGGNFGTNDFTISFWFYKTASGNQGGISYSDGAWNGWQININTSSISWQFLTGSSGTATITAGSYSLNCWNHITVTRASGTITLYVNGTSVGTASDSGSYGAATSKVRIGLDRESTYFTGYISDVKLVNGTAVAPSGNPTSPATATSGTSLLCNMTNGAIYDSSEVADYETVGNAQISTSVKKYGTGSLAFDGSSSTYLQLNSGTNFNFSGNFTIEFWFYTTTVSRGTILYDTRPSGGSGDYPTIYISYSAPNATLTFLASGSSISGTTPLVANTWYHAAVSRSGSTVKLFLNGTQEGSSLTNSATLLCDSNRPLIGVNSNSFSGVTPLNGYIDDLRVTKGYARYWENFTPPAAALPNFGGAYQVPTQDPQFNYTTLLLPGNGTNGAQNNTFLDSSTNAFTITRNGNTTQGTFTPFSQTGWGNYFDGSGDYLATPSNAAFAFGTGDYTIETWVYPQQFANQQIFNFSDDADNLSLDPAGTLTFYDGSIYTTGATYVLNQWQHIAYTRSSGTVRIFLNGTLVKSFSSSYNSGTRTAYFGARGIPTAGANCLLGYMSNIRIVKGTAVYTANFTPSTTPLTAVSGTSVLTAQSNRFIDNSTNAFTLTVNGTPSVQAFSPFAPTAAYSASTVGGSGYFDGSGDYLAMPSNSAFAFGTGDFTIEMFVYHNSLSGQQTYYSDTFGDTAGVYFYKDTSNFVGVYYGSQIATANTAIVGNQWNHVAVSRLSGTLRIFLNGTQVASVSDNTDLTNTNANIGGVAGGSDWMNGYISNVRVLKGTGYSSITVPTAPLTAITNTSLLCNFTNAAITDATAKNDLETVGNAQISTTQSKFGGSSLAFDGSGDYLTTVAQPTNSLGTGDFTLEFWVYINSLGSPQGFVGNMTESGSTGYSIYVQANNTVRFQYGGSYITSTNTLAANNWYHIAVVKYGSTATVYVNGSAWVSGTVTTDLSSTTTIIGRAYTDTNNYYLNGYINDLRITKGYARYVQPFTPPAQADQLY